MCVCVCVCACVSACACACACVCGRHPAVQWQASTGGWEGEGEDEGFMAVCQLNADFEGRAQEMAYW